ncbi:MAG: type II toxin-antitoxin system HicA family toxin [Bacillota bacterium]|nr:type II toxin-antitoxin system HicA family toxin [Bacillota bacterium]
MRLPRNLSGEELARHLRKYGYEVTRQTGSHIRLSTSQGGEHHVTVPRHDTLKLGTLSGVLNDVASHLGMAKESLLERLFGK